MSRKGKIVPVEKIRAVEKILMNNSGVREEVRRLGVDVSTISQWRTIYLSTGPSALADQKKNNTYSKELKNNAVIDYLNGEGSLSDICQKYGIRTPSRLRKWIKDYNTHGELKSRGSGGGSYMRKARKTTYEERLAIAQDCLDHDRNYGAMALKYGCSYQQVRNWVIRYEEMGEAGLEDRRGKRAGTLPSRTEEEKLRDEVARLKRQNEDLQMENALLKKVRELEMKDRCH